MRVHGVGWPQRGMAAVLRAEGEEMEEAGVASSSERDALAAGKVLQFAELRGLLPLTPQRLPEVLECLRRAVRGGSMEEVPPAPKLPVIPTFRTVTKMGEKLRRLQEFIESFEYNYTGKNYFNVRKDRPLIKVMDTCRHIVKEALPIKCVEGTFLAMYLTAGMELDRVPLSFKTQMSGHVFRHIVLAVRGPDGMWGALGLSRKRGLMYKKMEFLSLSALYLDFKKHYEEVMHQIIKVRVGLCVEHNILSLNPVCWRYLSIRTMETDEARVCTMLDEHSSNMKRMWDRWQVQAGPLLAKARSDQALANLTGDKAALMRRPMKAIKGVFGAVVKAGNDFANEDRRKEKLKSTMKAYARQAAKEQRNAKIAKSSELSSAKERRAKILDAYTTRKRKNPKKASAKSASTDESQTAPDAELESAEDGEVDASMDNMEVESTETGVEEEWAEEDCKEVEGDGDGDEEEASEPTGEGFDGGLDGMGLAFLGV